MSEATLTTVTLTTECECEIYDEETGEFRPSDGTECFGCYDTAWDDFRDNILAPWLDAIGADDDADILVEGTGMGWQGRAGWIVVTASDLHDALAINGEYRVDYALTGDTLTAVRYSHDEPTGTGTFRFSLAPSDAE